MNTKPPLEIFEPGTDYRDGYYIVARICRVRTKEARRRIKGGFWILSFLVELEFTWNRGRKLLFERQ